MILNMGGCEMVLGVQWLSTLGSVHWDFKALKMEFTHLDHRLVLRGTNHSSVQWIKGKQVRRSANNIELDTMALCVYPATYLSLENVQVTNEQGQQDQSKLISLLDDYVDVFQEPTTLPPNRLYDHQIVLKDESLPVNVRPYRHPPNKKMQ